MLCWNINGLSDKFGSTDLQNYLFYYDIIILLETQKGNDFNNTIPHFGFHNFPWRHIHKKAKWASGAIGFLNKLSGESVTISHAVEHCVWVSMKNRNSDCPNINIGCVYIASVGTSYCHPEITDYCSTLGKEILGKEKAGRIFLCGDFNARTADLNDLFVSHDQQ